jgi:hypothetical protein
LNLNEHVKPVTGAVAVAFVAIVVRARGPAAGGAIYFRQN